MANAGAVKAGDAFVEVSVDGLENIKAELGDLKSEIAKGFQSSNKLQAVSAIADGFRMISGAISSAAQAAMFFVNNIREAVERVSDLQKTADRLGTTITFISRLRVATITSGMSMSEMEQSFAAFQRNMETFSQGVGESKATFEALGITPGMLKGWGSLENQMMNIITKLGQIQDPSQRAGAAMRIFGEQGRKLIPLVNANATALQAMMKQADFLGMTLDGNAGRSLDRVRDNLRLMSEQVNALWDRLAVALAPELEKLTNELIVAFKTIFDVVTGGKEMNSVIDAIAESIKPMTKTVATLYVWFLRIQSLFLWFAEFRAKYDPVQTIRNWVMGWTSEENEALISSIENMRAETDASIDRALTAVESMDETFEKNRGAWKELTDASVPVTRELRAGAEEFKETAKEMKEIYKGFAGDVLGMTADDIRKARDMEIKLFGDMRNSLKSIDGRMRQSPVLRTI